MSVIRLSPSEVDSVGQQFMAKSQEVDALVKQAQSMMNNLQAEFTGQRATRINSEWQGMQQGLINAIQALQTTGNWLKKAAMDFQGVDQSF